MEALKNILTSGHGLIGLALILAATVLAIVGKMSIDQWTSYSQMIFAIFTGGHAAMTVGASLANRGNDKGNE